MIAFSVAFQALSATSTPHAEERFGTLVSAIPAGLLGARVGRRRVVQAGFAGMAAASVALHLAPSFSVTCALLGAFGLAWSLPVANLYPMAVEICPPERVGTYTGLFFMCTPLAGILGPPLAGALFDVAGSKRPLFLVMVALLALAWLAMRGLRPGFGEARAPAAA